MSIRLGLFLYFYDKSNIEWQLCIYCNFIQIWKTKKNAKQINRPKHLWFSYSASLSMKTVGKVTYLIWQLYKAPIHNFFEILVPIDYIRGQIWVIQGTVYALPQMSHHVTYCTNYWYRRLDFCIWGKWSGNLNNVKLHLRFFKDNFMIQMLN